MSEFIQALKNTSEVTSSMLENLQIPIKIKVSFLMNFTMI